jgi:hydroxyacyl-ACP dehydratase HTD2-like protein with hotdog domain
LAAEDILEGVVVSNSR